MEETFRLDLNQSWEAIDIKTGRAVLIPKGSHQAIRMLRKSPPDQTAENYLVVPVQQEGKPVLAGLRGSDLSVLLTLQPQAIVQMLCGNDCVFRCSRPTGVLGMYDFLFSFTKDAQPPAST